MERTAFPDSRALVEELLQRQFPQSPLATSETLDSMSRSKGAYALALYLPDVVQVEIRDVRFGADAGWYIYAGSAYGPGGIKARLRRHFQREKRLHWHVDRLSVAAAHAFAFVFENGSECEVVERLSGLDACEFPMDGFGSSDCRKCRSHLMRLGDQLLTGSTRVQSH